MISTIRSEARCNLVKLSICVRNPGDIDRLPVRRMDYSLKVMSRKIPAPLYSLQDPSAQLPDPAWRLAGTGLQPYTTDRSRSKLGNWHGSDSHCNSDVRFNKRTQSVKRALCANCGLSPLLVLNSDARARTIPSAKFEIIASTLYFSPEWRAFSRGERNL
jgi:hypothetical protein